MKVFDDLYTLDSKGKIRIFKCKVYLEKGPDFTIQTETGLFEGKLIKQIEKVKTGKQKRSIQEQAEFQAQSLWNDKLNEGYKSISMLRCQFHTAASVDEQIVRDAILEQPNWYYTNSNWDELPMLAHKVKDLKKFNFPYLIQPKLNGVRAICKVKNGNVLLISRGGSYYEVNRIQRQIADLYKNLGLLGNKMETILLDGELYKHGRPLQEISGAARKEDNSELFNDNDWLEYHIYDIININNLGLKQESRTASLNTLKNYVRYLPNIEVIDTYLVTHKEAIDLYHEKFISEGYEGAILRDINAKYEFNQRSKGLLKVKLFQDEEFNIIDCEVDPNKTVGESFVFILKNNINDKTFKARPSGTEQQKINWYINKDSWMGKKATVKFFERTVDRLPSHAHVMHKDTICLIENLRSKDE